MRVGREEKNISSRLSYFCAFFLKPVHFSPLFVSHFLCIVLSFSCLESNLLRFSISRPFERSFSTDESSAAPAVESRNYNERTPLKGKRKRGEKN